MAAIENPSRKTQATGLRLVPIESAALPTAPVLPRTRLNLLIGLLVGALLGVAYAIVRNQFDRRIKFVAAVEKTFNVPVVGVIPQAGQLSHKEGAKADIAVLRVSGSSGSHEAEAFRKLRTNLSYMSVDNPPRTIVVTSPNEGDGKSTVAANVAAAIAVTGQPVVLIDADLRRPTVADSFGLPEGRGAHRPADRPGRRGRRPSSRCRGAQPARAGGREDSAQPQRAARQQDHAVPPRTSSARRGSSSSTPRRCSR